jgi:hypothetical protein
MSVVLPDLVTTVRAVDDASDTLRQVASNAKSSMSDVEVAARQVEDAHKQMNAGLKDVLTGFSGVATSAFMLYNSYDRVVTSEVALDRANLIVKTSANAVEDAQNKLNAAVEKYGPDSVQAQSAAKDLQLAQERYQVATERADLAQGNLNQSMVSSALTVIPSVISAISSLSKMTGGIDKVTESLGILSGFSGLGGVTEALGSASVGSSGLGIALGALIIPIATATAAGLALVGALAAIGSWAKASYDSIAHTAEETARASNMMDDYTESIIAANKAMAGLGTTTITPPTTPTIPTAPSIPVVVVNPMSTATPTPTTTVSSGGGGGAKTMITMQEGGFGVVDKPTLFLAGEHEPEAYAFSPLNRIPAEKTERFVTINFNPTIHSGPVYGVQGAKELVNLIYDEFSRRIRSELKAQTFFIGR